MNRFIRYIQPRVGDARQAILIGRLDPIILTELTIRFLGIKFYVVSDEACLATLLEDDSSPLAGLSKQIAFVSDKKQVLDLLSMIYEAESPVPIFSFRSEWSGAIEFFHWTQETLQERRSPISSNEYADASFILESLFK